jgi:hypothetical protein
MVKKKHIRRTLSLICMAAGLLINNAAHAGIQLKMISINNAADARLISQATTTEALEVELSKHKIKPPNSDKGYDFAAKLSQDGSGLIPPASISCGSAIAIIATDDTSNRIAKVSDTGYRKYSVKVDGNNLLKEPLSIPEDNVIIFDDKTIVGDEICNKTPPGKPVAFSLMKDTAGEPVLIFQAKTADPADSFVIVANVNVKNKEKASVLSHASCYEDFHANQPGKPEEFIELVTDRDIAATRKSLHCDSDIIISAFNRVNGKRIKLKDMGFSSYEVLLNNVSFQHPIPVNDYEALRIQIYEDDETINVFGRKVCQAEQNKLVTVELATLDSKYQDYYVRREHQWVMYHSTVDIDGLWFPVGILAGKPRRTESGIIMSAFPIGAAFGTRYYTQGGSFYTGVSLIGSYGLGETNNEKTTANGDTKTFHGAALGLLIDINSYIYLMGAYQWSFVKDTSNPGWLIGFGFGAKLGSILAGK